MTERRMTQTIKARYHAGWLEPLEPLELDEGSEVLITVNSSSPGPALEKDPTLATSGAFKDSAEWAEYEKELEERCCRESGPEAAHDCPAPAGHRSPTT